MATNKSSSHHCYQIAPPINASKFVSKSTESLTNIDPNSENHSQKQATKASKMKKSQTTFNGFESKVIQAPQASLNSTSALRRRFSLFRIKRSQQQQQQQTLVNDPAHENSSVQALQQIIDQLRRDLQIKTDELETIRQRIEKKRSSIAVPTNESIEQAMHLQTMLNVRLEEMMMENDLLKKSIQELESYAQQQKCKHSKRFEFL